jgi:hypothetical protein
MSDAPIVQQYCRIASALRPMIEQIGSHEQRMVKILPEYQKFLDKLMKDKLFLVLNELRHSDARARSAGLSKHYMYNYHGPMLEDIAFPDTKGAPVTEGSSELEKFALYAAALRGWDYNPIANSNCHAQRISHILPGYQDFLGDLKTNGSDLLGELWLPQGEALNKFYGSEWPEFMAIAIIGHSGSGGGLPALKTRGDTLKQSVDWILSVDGNHGSAELLEPARFYAHWKDIQYPGHIDLILGAEDSPRKIFESMEELRSDSANYTHCSFFIAPKVKFHGLPLKEDQSIVPVALSNWYGDNSSLIIGRTPYDPAWDS